MQSVNWWQRYGTVAQMAQAGVAALGFGAVLLQLDEIRTSNRATSARQVYLAYADLEFRHPEFAAPDYERIKAGDADTRSRYESFVSYFLYACDEALAAFPGKREWRNTCEVGVYPHLPFLCEKNLSDRRFMTTFSDDMVAFISSAMTRARVVAPECKLKGA